MGSIVSILWESKSEGKTEISKQNQILNESILFIDVIKTYNCRFMNLAKIY